MAHGKRRALDLEHTRRFVEKLFGDDEHAARVLSLANGIVGVLHAALLSIHAIGQAYAKVAKITPKSGVKQVDRMLSNGAIVMERILELWVRFVVAEREQAMIALDWTDFDDDDHTTLAAYLVTCHGRATPLCWTTVKKSELKGRRTAEEHAMVERLNRWLPAKVEVELLADRGFGDQKLYRRLDALNWHYTIRFRGGIRVEASTGEARSAAEWLSPRGRALMLRGARVTEDRTWVQAVVVVHARQMKEPWCLVTSRAERTAAQVVKHYGRRFTIEETFRDQKDLRFGMGLRATHIHDAQRRDRLLLLVAVAHALLTLLGAASERAGLDRILKVNTVKKRTHSLYRQGCYWYDCIPTMREDWLVALMTAFDAVVREHVLFRELFGIV
ncbi:MAG: IS4 family transposase [Deltaproteobacteria bacterium]|nr:IS4 family transposase [Deltaproteobacteria bacterium]